MNHLEQIRLEIENNLKKVTTEKVNFSVDFPELAHGDVTTNACLVASKVLKVSPKEVFEMIEEGLKTSLKEVVSEVTFANPGFINFTLSGEFVKNELVGNTSKKTGFFSFFKKKDVVGMTSKYKGKHVLVEHSSPNLFKPFHIGHLMNNFTGEYIVRSMKELGAKVSVTSFPSDISIGIAKAIYMIKRDGGLAQNVFKQDEKVLVGYLSDCYVRGVNEYKTAEENGDEIVVREIKNISNNLYGNIKSVDLEIYEYTKKINLDYLYKNLKNLGSSFDGFIFESESGVVGKKIVEDNVGELGSNKVFKKSEGAVVYIPEEERKDINTTVFINSEGNPTYAAKDLGLLFLKFEKFTKTDYSFYVTDNEQTQHFKVVFAAAKNIKSEWVEKSIHVPHGRMTFKGAKMSSRLGGVLTGESVIDAVLEDVKERSGEKIKDVTEEEKESIQREIALSALRIAILRSKPGVNIDFDPEKASSFEGDSGPYLCYTFARTNSLLQKGRESGYVPKVSDSVAITQTERKVLQFSNVLKSSGEEIAPQKLVKYLFELSSLFNAYYAQNKIVGDDKVVSENNLFITEKVGETLKKGLYILGIQAPERM